MVKFVGVIGFLFSLCLVSAAESPIWENQAITSINKELPHATAVPFQSIENASLKKSDSPYFSSLNGDWKFNWVRTPDQRPRDFYKTDYDFI